MLERHAELLFIVHGLTPHVWVPTAYAMMFPCPLLQVDISTEPKSIRFPWYGLLMARVQ